MTNPVLRAIAEGLGLDADGVTDVDMQALFSQRATIDYRLDGNDQIQAVIVHPESE